MRVVVCHISVALMACSPDHDPSAPSVELPCNELDDDGDGNTDEGMLTLSMAVADGWPTSHVSELVEVVDWTLERDFSDDGTSEMVESWTAVYSDDHSELSLLGRVDSDGDGVVDVEITIERAFNRDGRTLTSWESWDFGVDGTVDGTVGTWYEWRTADLYSSMRYEVDQDADGTPDQGMSSDRTFDTEDNPLSELQENWEGEPASLTYSEYTEWTWEADGISSEMYSADSDADGSVDRTSTISYAYDADGVRTETGTRDSNADGEDDETWVEVTTFNDLDLPVSSVKYPDTSYERTTDWSYTSQDTLLAAISGDTAGSWKSSTVVDYDSDGLVLGAGDVYEQLDGSGHVLSTLLSAGYANGNLVSTEYRAGQWEDGSVDYVDRQAFDYSCF